MYNRTFEFKDLKGRPHKQTMWFHLYETEVFKLLVELKTVADWRTSLASEDTVRQLDAVEVVTFYTAFEEILLTAAGRPADDDLSFIKANRYELAESVAFNAAMVYFVSNPEQTNVLIEKLMPENLSAMIDQQQESLQAAAETAKGTPKEAEIKALQAKLSSLQGGSPAPETTS